MRELEPHRISFAVPDIVMNAIEKLVEREKTVHYLSYQEALLRVQARIIVAGVHALGGVTDKSS
jgi:hypothetical protein